MSAAKILVVDDEKTVRELVSAALREAGYEVDSARDGKEAIEKLQVGAYQAVLTDYLMPGINGIDLIRHVRTAVKPLPLLVMFTGNPKVETHAKAQDLGVTIYLRKPVNFRTLLRVIKTGLESSAESAIQILGQDGKERQASEGVAVAPPAAPAPSVPRAVERDPAFAGKELPPYPMVLIATSTGGPKALFQVMSDLPGDLPAPVLIVQHGPVQMFTPLSHQLQSRTKLKVMLGEHDRIPRPGEVHIAPGDVHMEVDPVFLKIKLREGPKENSVRPAADPLFRTAAEAFRGHCLAVVLTGLGRDGAQGARRVVECGGQVMIQDPEEAVAESMPKAVLMANIPCKVLPLNEVGAAIGTRIRSWLRA